MKVSEALGYVKSKRGWKPKAIVRTQGGKFLALKLKESRWDFTGEAFVLKNIETSVVDWRCPVYWEK